MSTIEEKLAYLKDLARETGDDLVSTVYWIESLPIEWDEEQRALIEEMKKTGAH